MGTSDWLVHNKPESYFYFSFSFSSWFFFSRFYIFSKVQMEKDMCYKAIFWMAMEDFPCI